MFIACLHVAATRQTAHTICCTGFRQSDAQRRCGNWLSQQLATTRGNLAALLQQHSGVAVESANRQRLSVTLVARKCEFSGAQDAVVLQLRAAACEQAGGNCPARPVGRKQHALQALGTKVRDLGAQYDMCQPQVRAAADATQRSARQRA
jgi:hypothetical protein